MDTTVYFDEFWWNIGASLGVSSADNDYAWEFDAWTEHEGKTIEGTAIYYGPDTGSLVFSHIECEDWDEQFEGDDDEIEEDEEIL